MVAINIFLSLLSLGLVALNVHAGGTTPPSTKNTIKVPPVRLDTIFPHLKKRDDDYSRFKLQNQVRLAWAHSSGKEKVVFDMKIDRPDPSHPLLALEELDDLVQNITCNEPMIKVKFRAKGAMDQALKAWDWINEKEVDYFYLIANHDGCGPDRERAPYKVVKVKYDVAALTAVLTTQPSSWEEAAANHAMSLGSLQSFHQNSTMIGSSNSTLSRNATSIRNTRRSTRPQFSDTMELAIIEKRGPIKEWFKKFGKKAKRILFKVGQKAAKIVNAGKMVWKLATGGTINLNVASPDSFKNKLIFHTPESTKGEALPVRFYADCQDCYSKGQIELKAQWRMVKSVFTEYVLTAKPMGVSGRFAVNTRIEADIQAFDYHELTPSIVPSFSIGVLTVGPGIFLGAGVGAKLKANANFTAGFTWSVPDSSYVEVHSLALKKSQVSGFKGTQVKPFLDIQEINVKGDFTPYTFVRIGLGVTWAKQTIGGRADFKVGFKTAVTAGTLAAGACPKTTDGKSLGVKVSGGPTFAIVLGLGLDMKDADISYLAYAWEKELYGVCFAAPIPKAMELGTFSGPTNTTSKVEGSPQTDTSKEEMQKGMITVQGKPVNFVNAEKSE
ncbi:hypothetical protein H072_919 [Dactylellina haptotyla CBS 200.50]|uniref:DUF7029 domain-containing protein n=1 Tax=Dactylellina haptotyla (strain CBS 200.50) TaxID=1284197 RepID=S8AVU0_DACHA|nr:hypothetical protein H072_919 [Dactylellina haptotyla CBS 200.50]